MFARTERLLLRPGWIEDAEALYHAIADADIVRNLARAPWPYTIADARDFAATAQSASHPHFFLFRRTGGNPQLVGCAGLAPCGDEAEIGYWIARPCWGLGYASEAVRAVVAIARAIGHRQLIAQSFNDNPASARVLQKTGFRSNGQTEMCHSRGRGVAVPAAVYRRSLTGDDCLGDPRGMMRAAPMPYDAQPIAA